MKPGLDGTGRYGRMWMGLGRSPFLADLTQKDRDPLRLLATLAGGASLGMVAATAAMLLVLVADVFLTGHGAEGLTAIGGAVIRMQAGSPWLLPNAVLELALAVGVNGAFAIVFVAVAALLAGHPLHSYITVARSVRWRLLVAGVVMGGLLLAPLVLIDRFWGDNAGPAPLMTIGRGAAEVAIYGATALLLIPAAAAEEIVFRGWLLRTFAAATRAPGLLIVLTGMVFSALHDVRLDAQGPRFVFEPDAFLLRTIMGAGFAYMTLRLGGIEFAVGAHAANNILIVLFVEPFSMRADEGAGALSVAPLFEDVLLAVGYVAITEAVVRLSALRRLAGVDEAELAPP